MKKTLQTISVALTHLHIYNSCNTMKKMSKTTITSAQFIFMVLLHSFSNLQLSIKKKK